MRTPQPVNVRELDDRVRELERQDLAELRRTWTSHWGPPPRLRSVSLLRALIAWRLQAAVQGGLDAGTRILLRSPGVRNRPTLAIGSRVSREYRGVIHHVDVVAGGFDYAGERFASLSAIARAITGVRWNGPRFFGLRPVKTP